MFQSTHLHEVWLDFLNGDLGEVGFNPHTYMRCDFVFESIDTKPLNVSIHTPTWGVTHCAANCLSKPHVSIHTPTWGVTHFFDIFTFSSRFQSTHLHEVWRRLTSEQSKLLEFQSTHLHEVWPCTTRLQGLSVCFNPHTYMRCDWASLDFTGSVFMFQSTHLHEVWHDSAGLLLCVSLVSIHTPTWGVTKDIPLHSGLPSVSIHTPTWGVTLPPWIV